MAQAEEEEDPTLLKVVVEEVNITIKPASQQQIHLDESKA
jgi:hypothetical protein